MPGKNLIYYIFGILATLAVISAQDASTPVTSDVSSLSPGSASFHPGFFDHLPFPFNGVENFHLHQLSNFPFPFPFGGNRKRRSPLSLNADEQERTDRLFFSLISRQLTTCNFTTEAGSSCDSCRVVRRCYPGNIGTLSTCGVFFPYCNNGRCSRIPGAQCSATTSTTAAATTISTTPTASTTSTTTATTTVASG